MCFFLACIDSVDITNYIEITQSIMPKPVYLLTVQEAQIWANYEQLEFWGSWHPSIQSWSLWIGKSTCSCEPTLPET